MGRLSIQSLGALQIALDASSLTGFDSDKVRGLLTYLAVESNRPHRRQSLAGLLWPEVPERRARHSLSQALWNIRDVIGDRRASSASVRFIQATRSTVQFRRTSDYWLDAEQLTNLGTQKPPLAGTEKSLVAIEDAIALYRGPFLEGLSVADSPAFEEWALLQRERLERLATDLLAVLIAGYAERGVYDRALRYAWRQLDLDSWREDAHRQVMRLLAWSGQRGAALRQYRTCCQLLETNLGALPEAETTELYAQIQANELAAPRPPAAVPHPRAALLLHNLPAPLTSIVGRAAALTEVRARLNDPECRLLTLTGVGGIGKTRLAVEAARGCVSGFAAGVFLVPLSVVSRVEAAIPAIARSIGLCLSDQGGPAAAQLQRYLRDRDQLLILDGAEHLTATAGIVGDRHRDAEAGSRRHGIEILIADLLAAAPGLKVLVTSRVKLGLLGETVLPVGPLEFPSGTDASSREIAQLSSVQLFVQSAQRVMRGFELLDANAGVVASICRILEGHPLALLMAAAWVPALPCRQIASVLGRRAPEAEEDRVDLMRAAWPNVPLRHQSLRAVFAGSWQLLPSHARAVLAALSVFRGGFLRRCALEVAEATQRDLSALLNASLLVRAPSGRYTMHAIVRLGALAMLQRDPVVHRRVRERWCAYYGNALTAWTQAMKGSGQQAMLGEVDEEIDNVREAWDWAVEQGDLPFIERASLCLVLYYARRARWEDAEDMAQAAVDRLEALSRDPERCTGDLLRVLSLVLHQRSWFPLRAKNLSSARRSLEVLDDPRLVGHDVRYERACALRAIADQLREADRQQAVRFYGQSLELFRAVGADWEASGALTDLANCAWHMGDLAGAHRYYTDALRIARALDDARSVIATTQGLSSVAMARGDLEAAAALSEESLALARQIGDTYRITYGMAELGLQRVLLGQLSEARSLLKGSIRLQREELCLPSAFTESVLAWAMMHAGSYDEASQRLAAAVSFLDRHGGPRAVGWSSYVQGGILLAQGCFGEAEEELNRSIQAYRAIGQRTELSSSLSLLANALSMQDRSTEARDRLVEALTIACDAGAGLMIDGALLGFALVTARQGDVSQALVLQGVAGRLSSQVSTPWSVDVIDNPIEAAVAAAGLTDAEVAAARARGRALSVERVVDELLEDGG